MSRSSLKEIGKRPFFMSTLKRKVLLLYDPPEDITGNFFFTIFPSLSFHRLFLPHFNFHQIHIFLNLHQGKRNSRLTIFFLVENSLLSSYVLFLPIIYEYKFGYDYDRCGSSKYQFFTPSLTAFPHTDGHKEFFLHRIINCFYLLIYLIVLKNK